MTDDEARAVADANMVQLLLPSAEIRCNAIPRDDIAGWLKHAMRGVVRVEVERATNMDAYRVTMWGKP